MRLRQYIERTAARLEQAGVHCGHGTSNFHDEAIHLLFGALGLDYARSVDEHDRALSGPERARIESLVRKRIDERVPVAYLLGVAWFAGHEFLCDRRALVPRSPIGELIGNRFEPLLPEAPGTILDLCCGGGCIGIACALQFPAATVELADLSQGALDLAQENIGLHRLAARVATRRSDLCAGLQGPYDLIVANPPYVSRQEIDTLPREYRHEPTLGLDGGGADGLELVARLLGQAASRLSERGLLILESGHSAVALQERFPAIPFLWLEFEHGGSGICALNRAQLQKLASSGLRYGGPFP